MKLRITAGLVAVLFWSTLLAAPFLEGCNGVTVAQDIVNWVPSLQAAVATVDSTAALLDPAAASIFTAATAGFDAASNLAVSQAQAYLKNPTTTFASTLAAQLVAFQQNVNTGLLEAAKIVNPKSQALVLAALNAVSSIVNIMVSLIKGVKGVTIVASTTAVTLLMIKPYRDDALTARLVAEHYGIDQDEATARVNVGYAQMQAAGL
jgi:hypothetical protein